MQIRFESLSGVSTAQAGAALDLGVVNSLDYRTWLDITCEGNGNGYGTIEFQVSTDGETWTTVSQSADSGFTFETPAFDVEALSIVGIPGINGYDWSPVVSARYLRANLTNFHVNNGSGSLTATIVVNG